MSILQASQLCYHYPSAHDGGLEFPDFKIEKSEAWLVGGPSGSGKSTLLHLISGIIDSYQGSLLFDGQEIKNLSAAKRDRIRHEQMGNIYQSFNLIPYLSVLENILLPAEFLGVDFHERAFELLERVGLKNFAHRNTTALSVGQQQRVAAVRALLLKPQLLLADEPTSALDPENKNIFIKILFELCKSEGTTLLFVSHDPSLHSLFENRLELSASTTQKTEQKKAPQP
jgi:putative ABC transport system ATP-binding protein